MRRRTTRIKRASYECSHREFGQYLGNARPATLYRVLFGILFQISKDIKRGESQTFLRHLNHVALYLSQSIEALFCFDDWRKDDAQMQIPEIAYSCLNEVLGRSIASLEYGPFHEVMAGLLASLTARLKHDDRLCLKKLHIYVNLVVVYSDKVRGESAILAEAAHSRYLLGRQRVKFFGAFVVLFGFLILIWNLFH